MAPWRLPSLLPAASAGGARQSSVGALPTMRLRRGGYRRGEEKEKDMAGERGVR